MKVSRKHKVYCFQFKCLSDLLILQPENLKIQKQQKNMIDGLNFDSVYLISLVDFLPQNLLSMALICSTRVSNTFLGEQKYCLAKNRSGVLYIYKLTIALKIRKVPGTFHIQNLLQLTIRHVHNE